jgi:phospholipase C
VRRLGTVVLVTAAAIAAASAGRVGAAPPRALAAPAARVGPRGVIEHVVVIFQENHSFDETLGAFCMNHKGRCDGYVGVVHMKDGSSARMTKSSDIVPSVWHDVRAQRTAMNGGKMNGWNAVFGCNPPSNRRNCLTYYTPKQIPNLAALAQHFALSDRTFSMFDSPSWGGHVYVAAASQDNFTGDLPYPAKGVKPGPGWGCDSNLVAAWRDPKSHHLSPQPSCIPARSGTLDPKKFPYSGPFRASPVRYIPTIFDRLDAANLPWRIYSTTDVFSVCPTFAECAYGPQRRNVVSTYNVITDAQRNKLPAYSLVLPSGPGGTAQHNGHSMGRGDNWIGKVVNEIEHSRDWSSTAIFITYDDCGCFYDHVRPGRNPDGTQQGIRLPMVIVSPYAKRSYTDSHSASLASILRFTEKTFGLKALNVNDARAYDYANTFNFGAQPTGARVQLRQYAIPAASRRYLAAHPVSEDDEDDPT